MCVFYLSKNNVYFILLFNVEVNIFIILIKYVVLFLVWLILGRNLMYIIMELVFLCCLFCVLISFGKLYGKDFNDFFIYLF